MLDVLDAGVKGYREAWDLQLQCHDEVLAGPFPGGRLILVEHPPTITIGRHPGAAKHLLASAAMLQARGVEVVETDRGGDITFHGPGQLVAYPILNLNVYNMNLHGYMRLLEEVVIATVGAFGIRAIRVGGCTGVWIDPHCALRTQDSELRTQSATDDGGRPDAGVTTVCSNKGLSKICAMGIKLRRWTTLHGLALNVTTDLSYFDLINPCGLSRPVTSMRELLGADAPAMALVKEKLVAAFCGQLQQRGSANRG